MRLHKETVSDLLLSSLQKLMKEDAFCSFRLVGGTALTLQLGHRISIDIDLFTDIEYGSMDMNKIRDALKRNFNYVEGLESLEKRELGYSLYCGDNPNQCIKIDLFYTDRFILPAIWIENIRMADIREIAAMKILAIENSSRKKDYWDIHELMNYLPLDKMVELGEKRHPYEIDRLEVINNLKHIPTDIDNTPLICLKGKYWEFVIEDIEEAATDIWGREDL